jgi:rhodanese-related sulfurtransferase
MMAEIKTLDPKTLKFWLDKNEVILVDVREPLEYKEAHI